MIIVVVDCVPVSCFCRDSVPRMPKQALMMVAGVTGAELAKREIAAQVRMIITFVHLLVLVVRIEV